MSQTEHLDSELGRRIEQVITERLREKIAIVVTHSGWENCNKTLTMEVGRGESGNGAENHRVANLESRLIWWVVGTAVLADALPSKPSVISCAIIRVDTWCAGALTYR